jgi:hypothetical protein
MALLNHAVLHVFSPFIVDVLKIESMDMSRQIAQQSKEDVDTKVNTTSGNQKDTERWYKNLHRFSLAPLRGDYRDDHDEYGRSRHSRVCVTDKNSEGRVQGYLRCRFPIVAG